jgi:hypothetical protein
MIVVPDTSPRERGIPGHDDDWDFGTGAGFSVDATMPLWSEHYRMYSYVTDELPALIDAHLPTCGAWPSSSPRPRQEQGTQSSVALLHIRRRMQAQSAFRAAAAGIVWPVLRQARVEALDTCGKRGAAD